MKHLNFISGLLTILLILSITSGFVPAVDSTKAKNPDTPKIEKGRSDSAIETAGGQSDTSHKNSAVPAAPSINENAVLIITVLFFAVMLFLFYKLFGHLKDREQYIGFQSIKLIGLILMFPGICILALAGGGLIGGSTLAALLGTIAGYVLSREDDPKDSSLKEDYTKLKKDKDALDDAVKNLKIEIEELKKQIAG
ncbi:hypothetical protein [Flavobacterium sp. LC2016-01]|uniref:hypothetical protein n=1 Tax=Flavobacterium sp. LC2016-01 TaxID=2675876 RepID=UPI0012BAD81F|nr:hypothetical protein [Flavobacterium sp. LC2016-01]MTH13940.1 hypothetical protein [Flavobacterium sp. LC2016-01]